MYSLNVLKCKKFLGLCILLKRCVGHVTSVKIPTSTYLKTLNKQIIEKKSNKH